MRHTVPLVACVNLGLGRFAPLCKRRHHTIPVLFIGAPPNLQKHLVIEHSTIPLALNCNAGHDWTISHSHRYITLTVLQGVHSLVWMGNLQHRICKLNFQSKDLQLWILHHIQSEAGPLLQPIYKAIARQMYYYNQICIELDVNQIM